MNILEKIENVLKESKVQVNSKGHWALFLISKSPDGKILPKFLRDPWFDNTLYGSLVKRGLIVKTEDNKYALTEDGKSALKLAGGQPKEDFWKSYGMGGSRGSFEVSYNSMKPYITKGEYIDIKELPHSKEY